jgi:hypothetical protein
MDIFKRKKNPKALENEITDCKLTSLSWKERLTGKIASQQDEPKMTAKVKSREH